MQSNSKKFHKKIPLNRAGFFFCEYCFLLKENYFYNIKSGRQVGFADKCGQFRGELSALFLRPFLLFKLYIAAYIKLF